MGEIVIRGVKIPPIGQPEVIRGQEIPSLIIISDHITPQPDTLEDELSETLTFGVVIKGTEDLKNNLNDVISFGTVIKGTEDLKNNLNDVISFGTVIKVNETDLKYNLSEGVSFTNV